MGNMKRRFILLGLITVAFIAVPAIASVTVEQSTDAEYIINQGYSQLTAEDIFMAKNRAVGAPIEPLYNKNQNILVKSWKAFWAYVDPSRDEFDRLHHNIKPTPSASDL